MNLLDKKHPESKVANRNKSAKKTNFLTWFALVMLCFMVMPTGNASAETRKLKLYFLHTGEKAEIAYKKNGRYIPSGLKKINRFLRDWRRNEPTKMDPKLLDLIWEVNKKVKGRKYIHVVSGYRSLKTNNLLRKRGRGVAKKSQHSLGKALDFFIPGVKLATLRKVGLQMGLGGVGYYPRSGSPFVHMDTGRVRHWPRMSRKQLVRVFPKGKTLHVPTDGKPLPGYKTAKLEYERKIKGFKVPSSEEIVKKPGLFAKLFNQKENEDEADATSAPSVVTTKKVTDPKPAAETTLVALLPNINTVPVPTIAPRNVTSGGTALALNNTITNDAEILSQEEPQVEEQEQLAFIAPVPEKRPAIQVADAPAIEIAPQPVEEPNIQVAALSPTEIHDLRQQVYSTLKSRDGVNNPAPSPQANIPFAPPLDEQEAMPFSPPLDEQRAMPFSPPLDEQEAMPFSPPLDEIEAKQPEIEETMITEAKPLEAIEPGVKSTGIPATPTINPQPKATPAPIETASLNVPVPQKNPLDTEVKKAQPAKPTPGKKTAVVGKWAMVNTTSIAQIPDMNAPNYERNILRERPNRVLAQGFSKVQLGSNTRAFTGSSLEFLDFTKLN